ncbi:BAG domain-containing protein [Rhypophila decipiens]|uniref:BAG domain-containing protein n=1 Tax=Rhypophila decipiens TaxID=261697 RepID=A0AAN6Y2I3_9PEZI|nr:BAG domain-containing protein [Rhypophila decipiens]
MVICAVRGKQWDDTALLLQLSAIVMRVSSDSYSFLIAFGSNTNQITKIICRRRPVVGPAKLVKVASGGDLASLGASFASLANNITSPLLKLQPILQTCLDTYLELLSQVSDYLESSTGYNPITIYTTAIAVVLLAALPTLVARGKKTAQPKKGKMSSRYGWTSRPGLSPFNSTLGDGAIPAVTDEDYSYITSEDLQDHNSRGLDPHYGRNSRDVEGYSHSAPGPSSFDQYEKPEDDVMLIKYRGIIYPEHFPAYSIGDGQLYVSDVIERVRYLFRIPERDSDRIRLLYKGRHLASSQAPVREYGVKNNSEVLVMFTDRTADSNSDSSEEIVVVGRDGQDAAPKKSRKKRGRKGGNDRSPRDSNSSLGLDVPAANDRQRAASRVRRQSPPSGPRSSSASVNVPVGVPGGPIEKMNTISSHFNTKLLPLCLQFTMNTPTDPKKKEEEHRKLSETVMQQVLLKLDEIDTSVEEGARARRKELVHQVQNVLKGLDEKLKE